jgi:hypothetical protein
MKWTQVCPLLGVVLLACATGENQGAPAGLGLGGSDATGGTSEPTAGTGFETGGGGSSGASAEGGSSGSDSSMAGTFGFSGSFSFAGTFGTAGTESGGTGAGGSGGKAGSGGSGGTAGAGGKGGSGGRAGAGGKGGSGGTAGAGGNAMCAGTTIPAKTTWIGTASQSDNAYPPEKVFDGDNTTRWSTGTKQVGGEWLQIDFGEVVTINEVTMFTNNNDYFRHYELRLSNTSQDFAAPVLKSADGATGSIVVPLAPAKAGQYLTIRQTGADAAGDIAWWSLHEVSVACK